MISITPPVFDVLGGLWIESPNPDGLTEFSRRVTRSPTLDGGVFINDFGYSDGDRTLEIEWTPSSEAEADRAAELARLHSRLIVSMKEGVFLGAPGRFYPNDGTVTLIILVERKLSE